MSEHAWVPGTSEHGYGPTGKTGMRWLMAVPVSARVAWSDRKLQEGTAVWPLPSGVTNLYPRSSGGSQGAAAVILWPTISLLARAGREPSAPTCVVAGPGHKEEDAARGWAIALGAVNLATGQVEPDPVSPETREEIAGIVTVGYNGWSRTSHAGKALVRSRNSLLADPGFTPGLIVGAAIAEGMGTGRGEDIFGYFG